MPMSELEILRQMAEAGPDVILLPELERVAVKWALDRILAAEAKADLMAAALRKADNDGRMLKAKLDLSVRECDRLLEQLIESRAEVDRLREVLIARGSGT